MTLVAPVISVVWILGIVAVLAIIFAIIYGVTHFKKK